jgi:hypothetical protein
MKSIRNFLIITIVSFSLLSCGEDNDPQLTEQQEMAMALDGTWSHAETTAFPQIGDPEALNDLVITFGVEDNYDPANFEAAGAPFFFETSGNSQWAFANATTTEFIQFTNSGTIETVKITLNDTEDVLTMEFAHPGDQGAKIKSLTGDYLIKLNKN